MYLAHTSPLAIKHRNAAFHTVTVLVLHRIHWITITAETDTVLYTERVSHKYLAYFIPP